MMTFIGRRSLTRRSLTRRSLTRGASRVASLIAGLVAVALAVGITGCSGIPRSGSVQQGQPVSQEGVNAIEFLPASPFAGATPEQILRGFLDAASSPQDDFAIAREYLGSAFKTVWDASASVNIDSGNRSFTEQTETTATLETVTSATVDGRGQYREVRPNSPLQVNYEFVNEGGEWRISAAPDGVIIDRFTFDQVFASHSLYFFDPTFTHFVPDVRWFPSGSSTATRIMKALLLGPAEWLAEGGAVVTAFPAETALVADAVPIASRMALVDLTSQALEATREGLQHMQAQASASLSSVDTVSTVELLVDGNVQEIVTVTNPSLDVNARVDGRALAMADGAFGFLTDTAVESIPSLSPLLAPLNPSAVTVASSLTVAAARTDAGVVLLRSTSGVTVLDDRQGLISPALDSANYIWSVPADAPLDIYVYSTDGQREGVVAPWSEATKIVALNISRDGSRLVALLEQDGKTRFVAANIQRGDRNRPVKIGTPIELATDAGIPLDAAWADALTVVSLVEVSDGSSRLISQTLGGQSERLPDSVGIVSLAGANIASQLRILSADGNLSVLRGSSYWQVVASKVSVLATLQ